MNSQGLSNDDLVRVAEMLERLSGGTSLDLEGLDGFVAGVACHPDRLSEGECRDAIAGDPSGKEAYAVQQIWPEFFFLVTRYLEATACTLQAGEQFVPLLFADADGFFCANHWAVGFLRGTQLRAADWAELAHDEEHGAPFRSIISLAANAPVLGMRTDLGPLGARLTAGPVFAIGDDVMSLCRYFRRRGSFGTLDVQ
jgi:uncharacterized protein